MTHMGSMGISKNASNNILPSLDTNEYMIFKTHHLKCIIYNKTVFGIDQRRIMPTHRTGYRYINPFHNDMC